MDIDDIDAPTSVGASCASSRAPDDVVGESGAGEIAQTQPSQSQGHGFPPRPNKRRSWTWDHFIKVEDDDRENPKARCHHCGELFGCHLKKQGTSILSSHIKGCMQYKIKLGKLDKDQRKLSFEAESGTDGTISKNLTTMPQYNEKRIRELIARMVIKDEQPFLIVEAEGFCDLIKGIEPRFTIPSRYTVMRDCLKIHAKEKELLKGILASSGQRISFTTDTWTSIQNINYMCITAHFIDSEWMLHKRIISFRRISDHKGATIGRQLEECMIEWRIEKFLAITIDNASANDTAVDWLKRGTLSSVDTICQHQFIHVRCCAHILNLIVNEGLKDIDDSVVKVRNLIKYVKSSPQRLEKFKTCVERRKLQCGSNSMLCLDVPTRWNSTYKMLDVAEKYQRAFELMQEEDTSLYHHLYKDGPGRRGLGPPDFDDWDTVRYFVKFLEVFYDATMHISGTLYPTSNMYFEELSGVYEHLQECCDSNDMLLKGMTFRMKSKYDKYWGDVEKINRLLFVAAILDPCYKLVVVELWLRRVLGDDKTDEFIVTLRSDIDNLYGFYSNFGGSSSGLTSYSTVGETPTSLDDTLTGRRGRKGIARKYHQIRASRNTLDCKSEIERYLMEEVEAPSDSFDILIWWKTNSTKFSILSRVARDVLAIPITTVASESAFSTGGRVLDAYRSSLAPNTMEALICAQNWLRSSPIGLDGVDDAESYRLDSEVSANPAILTVTED